MNTLTSYSATLVVDRGLGKVCCRACSTPVSAVDANWKDAAILCERPLNESGGPYATTSKDVVLRQFFCTECAALLDSEIALPGEPFLYDRLDG